MVDFSEITEQEIRDNKESILSVCMVSLEGLKQERLRINKEINKIKRFIRKISNGNEGFINEISCKGMKISTGKKEAI